MKNNEQTTESALIRWGCQICGAPPPPPRSRAKILLCSNGEKQLSRRANSITACLSDVPAAARSQRDRYEEPFFFVVFCCLYLTETLAVWLIRSHWKRVYTPNYSPSPLHLMFMKLQMQQSAVVLLAAADWLLPIISLALPRCEDFSPPVHWIPHSQHVPGCLQPAKGTTGSQSPDKPWHNPVRNRRMFDKR